MELGFETVGSATLICHDREPVLVTDPWLFGPAYFGSWALSHCVPDEQLAAIGAAQFVWISHGHPDHLNLDPLLTLRGKRFLVSDHVGNRIHDFLAEAGFGTTVLHDRRWVELSPRIRVQSLAHYNQDSILLVEMGDALIINMNDAPSTVWAGYIRRLARSYRTVVLLRLNGRPDGELHNQFDESGRRVTRLGGDRLPIGKVLVGQMHAVGANVAVPFSSLHRYQRADSVWANAFAPDVADHAVGFDARVGELLPPFISYDVRRACARALDPEPRREESIDPRVIGDDWSDSLSSDEAVEVRDYFGRRPLLGRRLDFLRLVVGGDEVVMRWSARDRDGVTFEVPRGSLMAAVRHEIFDDLLIGNFMKTTLHGRLQTIGLYPALNPYLGKWADNGRATTGAEVHDYLRQYARRAPLANLLGRLDDRAKYAIRAHVVKDSAAYDFLRRMRRAVPA